jgi:D-3-phosphoglycerate dehydrogenase
VVLVGNCDIGGNTARRLQACEMYPIVYDPNCNRSTDNDSVQSEIWPNRLSEYDYIVLTCALTSSNRHIINDRTIPLMKDGVRIINVSRGPLICEKDLVNALKSGKVHSVALEVMEIEPLPSTSELRKFEDRVIFGSHNASYTIQAVDRTSLTAINIIEGFLKKSREDVL